jgi:hypothetical protein
MYLCLKGFLEEARSFHIVGHVYFKEGHFTPRGRANLLRRRLEIFSYDWPKGSNWSQPLYT